MPLQIVKSDRLKMTVDAVVNIANPPLFHLGRQAGGSSITQEHQQPYRYIIHTIAPRYRRVRKVTNEQLRACYQSALELAKQAGCDSIAIPLITPGNPKHPKNQTLQIAVACISTFLFKNDMTVYLVVLDQKAYTIDPSLYADIQAFADSRIEEALTEAYAKPLSRARALQKRTLPGKETQNASMPVFEDHTIPMAAVDSLEDAVKQIDESFTEMLLRKIDQSGMTEVQCYKKANIDRKLFSKIRSDRLYRPSKQTALAFAIALEMSLEETRELLMKAGFALSRSSKFDIIIEYFISKGNYNIFQINEALFAFDQSLLGA